MTRMATCTIVYVSMSCIMHHDSLVLSPIARATSGDSIYRPKRADPTQRVTRGYLFSTSEWETGRIVVPYIFIQQRRPTEKSDIPKGGFWTNFALKGLRVNL